MVAQAMIEMLLVPGSGGAEDKKKEQWLKNRVS
jgi:hypothetical protein